MLMVMFMKEISFKIKNKVLARNNGLMVKFIKEIGLMTKKKDKVF